MFIGYDIGNTSTKLGLYGDNSTFPQEIKNYPTKKQIDQKILQGDIKNIILDSLFPDKSEIKGIAFSSVVPELNEKYREINFSLFGIIPLEINYRCKTRITILYDNPESLGADRIVNAEAAYIEYGEDLIIVDIGTAATFCVLSGSVFEGGLIAPGIELTKKVLAANTSNLPEIIMEKPDRIVARDTINAIKSGFYYGWLSLVDGIIKIIEAEYKKTFKLIFTGGYSKLISENINKNNIYDPLLTMKGIKYIYNHNRQSE